MYFHALWVPWQCSRTHAKIWRWSVGFFQSLFWLLFCLLSSPARWVLPASLLASLASCCFLSVWFALHRRAAVFGPVFSVRVPTSWECVLAKQEGSLKLCALLGFSILRFFCLLPLFFGLVCCAPHSFGFYSLGLVQRFDILPRSVLVLVGSEKGLIVALTGLRKKFLIRCQISSSKIILVRFHKKSLSV